MVSSTRASSFKRSFASNFGLIIGMVIFMLVTCILLERIKTPKGGYTKNQAIALGVEWPLQKGWKKAIIGKNVVDEELLLSEVKNLSSKIGEAKELRHEQSKERVLDLTHDDTWRTRSKNLKTTYEEFLQSDHWKQVKKKALSRKKTYGKCQICGTDKNIDLHHTSYKWIGTKHELRNVIPLCRRHHNEVHEYAKRTGYSVRISTLNVKSLYNQAYDTRRDTRDLPG